MKEENSLKAVLTEKDYSKKLPVAQHLSDEDYKILINTYARHNSFMGLAQRDTYSLANVVKVEKNTKENCLNVYYANGDWWHYTKSNNWY